MFETTKEEKTKKPRGFATMTPERLAEIASKGGKKAHSLGVAYKFNSEDAKIAGKKGGLIISANKEHMKEIGRKGGISASLNKKKSL